jgi:pectate lyase
VFSKVAGPVPGAYGPGHNAVFTDPNGGWWNVYHANYDAGQGCGGSRRIRIQHVYWNTNGKPEFGVPLPYNAIVSDSAAGEKLYDDFEDGNDTGWTRSSGTWSVVTDGSKAYKQSASSGLSTYAAGNTTWTNYAVTADIKPLTIGSGGTISLSARVRDTSNRYLAVFSSSSVTIKKATTAGGQVSLASANVSLLPTGSWLHDYTFLVNGSTLQVFADGVFVVAASDSTFGSGGVALSTSGSTTAEFDNVTVREP